jgi:hypothetical protein
LRYVTKTRLLGLTIDNRLSWVPHVLDLEKSFANKLELVKRSRFLPKEVLLKLYFSVILPSIVYGLVLWGACCNSNIISSIERLFCRAAKIIFNLPKDMASGQVLNFANWITIRLDYKVEIFKLFYNANNDILPDSLSKSIFRNRESSYSLCGQNVALIPRYNSRLMRDSLAFRGSALWNLVNCNDKIDNLNFKEIKRLLITKEYFKTFSSTAQLPPYLNIEMVITCTFRNLN